jgi:hypothetical protein
MEVAVPSVFQGAIRVRHFRLTLSLLTLLLAFAGSALADTVSMTFMGPSGNNSGGVYTYPYEFSINGSAPVALICDAFDNEVVSGETWTATVTSLLSGSQTGGGGLFAGQTLQYKAAGLIFEGILSGAIDANKGNWAIWGLFSADAQSNSYFQSNNLLAYEQSFLALASAAPDSWFQGLVLYTPVAGTQSWKGSLPQEYIGYVNVPEPAETALMLLMVIGSVLGFAFRQRLGLKLAIAHQA